VGAPFFCRLVLAHILTIAKTNLFEVWRNLLLFDELEFFRPRDGIAVIIAVRVSAVRRIPFLSTALLCVLVF